MLLSEWLRDASSFSVSWDSDPSVIGMLKMLDAINDKFKSKATSLATKLLDEYNPVVLFDFLTINQLDADADEIFVKMNSRGKQLTEFEYFKADLLRRLDKNDVGIDVSALSEEIDNNWTNVLWEYFKYYPNNDQSLDERLMRLTNYILDMIGFMHIKGHHDLKKNKYVKSDIDKILNDASGKLDKGKMEILLDSFSTLCRMQKEGGIQEFFTNRFSCDLKEDRIRLYQRNLKTPDLLIECLKDKCEIDSKILLWGIVCYVSGHEQECWNEQDFVRRARSLRNLLLNMDKGQSEMPYLTKSARSFMVSEALTFDFESASKSFTDVQIAEERLKCLHAIAGDEFQKWSDRLEDSGLYGRVKILYPEGWQTNQDENIDWKDNFVTDARLFKTLVDFVRKSSSNTCLLRRALLFSGEKLYALKNGGKYWFGSTMGSFPWVGNGNGLFTRAGNDEPLREALRDVLQHLKSAKVQPDDMIVFERALRSYIEGKEYQILNKNIRWDLLGYLRAYPEMLEEFDWQEDGNEGLIMSADGKSQYNLECYHKHTRNGQYWDPYLVMIFKKLGKLADYKAKLRKYGSDHMEREVFLADGKIGLRCRHEGFLLRIEEESLNEPIKQILKEMKRSDNRFSVKEVDNIGNQSELILRIVIEKESCDNSIDKIDRIQLGVDILNRLIQFT